MATKPKTPLSATSPRTLPVWLLHAGLFAGAFIYLIPFLWLVCASFKSREDIFSHAFLPWTHLRDLTFDNFVALFSKEPFSRWLMNSLFVASLQTVLVVTFSSLGGFALAKYEFHGKKTLMLLMLATMLLPGIVLLSGYIDLMVRLDWINSYKAVILPARPAPLARFCFGSRCSASPTNCCKRAGSMGAANCDFGGKWRSPVVKPTVGAFTLMSFIASWNSYLWPATVLQDQSKFTVAMGLAGMMGLTESESNYGILMAGTLVGIVPLAILFFVLQKDFVAGLTQGAVKG